MHLGLTLGISVVSVGDTAEPLLPGGVPDLGRDGHTVRRRQAQGRWWAEETRVMVREVCGKAASLLLCFSWAPDTCRFLLSAVAPSPAQGTRAGSREAGEEQPA